MPQYRRRTDFPGADGLRAYDFTTDRGAMALNDYARSNDPFTRVGRQQVAVDVSSVIR
ncbi:VirB8/TrbF family protein, partial [Aeromonas caviae]